MNAPFPLEAIFVPIAATTPREASTAPVLSTATPWQEMGAAARVICYYRNTVPISCKIFYFIFFTSLQIIFVNAFQNAFFLPFCQSRYWRMCNGKTHVQRKWELLQHTGKLQVPVLWLSQQLQACWTDVSIWILNLSAVWLSYSKLITSRCRSNNKEWILWGSS